MSKPPRYLYKYVSLATPERCEWLRQCIVESTIFLSSPLDFNDPFESRFTVDSTEDPEEGARALADPAFRQTIGVPVDFPVTTETVGSLLEYAKTRRGPYPDDLRTEFLKDLAVCCFSKRATVPLMWSHYADRYRGVCLRFDTHRDHAFFSHAHPVTYQSTFPRIDLLCTDSKVGATRTALTKAGYWRYEGEWRVILVESVPGPHQLNPAALDAVVFGWSVPDALRALITGWRTANQRSLRFLCLGALPDRYGLSLYRVKLKAT